MTVYQSDLQIVHANDNGVAITAENKIYPGGTCIFTCAPDGSNPKFYIADGIHTFTQLNLLAPTTPGTGGIDSVNGDPGPVVVLDAPEIGFSGVAGFTATNVRDAIQEAKDDAIAAIPAPGTADLTGLRDAFIAIKRWNGTSYVWPTGTAPSDGFLYTAYVGPTNPQGASGGPVTPTTGDWWVDTSVVA